MITPFGTSTKVINVGLSEFASDIAAQHTQVAHVKWKPPAGGDVALLKILEKLNTSKVEKANVQALEKIMNSQPELIGIGVARKNIPGMKDNMILHAGPPLTWKNASGPTKGAILGALVYEGKADSLKSAEKLVKKNEIEFSPCHEHNTVGPMTGVVSPSMPVYIVKNKKYGNIAHCTINEGLGKVLRFGANGDDVLEKLKWMETNIAPVIKATLEIHGPVDLKSLISQSLHMGDECHNRNKAATSLYLREIAPSMFATEFSSEQQQEAFTFFSGNDHTFLNLSMPACKATTDAAHGIKNCTMVTSMSRNGTDFGIRISALPDEWFVATSPKVKGLYFPGYTETDACADLGDSTITESAGIGGFAMAAAPAIVQFVGGAPEDALHYTRQMGEITLGKHSTFTIPAIDFSGSPTGIDVRKVVEKNITPFINTGIAHKDPGVGQIGAGIVRAPIECFRKALIALDKEIN